MDTGAVGHGVVSYSMLPIINKLDYYFPFPPQYVRDEDVIGARGELDFGG